MKKATIFLILFSLLGFVSAQTSDFQRTTIESVQGDYVSVDPNGNAYVVSGSTLYKVDSAGQLLYSFTNSLFGKISSIDVDNPLKIMLFYYDEALILFLDEKLVPISEPLDLFAHDFKNIKLVTYSTDNTIWFYDAVSQDLINANFQLKELSRNHLALKSFNPTQFFSLQEKQLVMNNPSTGVAFFDAFGTYLKTLPFTNQEVNVDASHIFYVKSQQKNEAMAIYADALQLCIYDYVKMDQQQVDMPLDMLGVPAIHRNRLYFMDKDKNLNILTIK